MKHWAGRGEQMIQVARMLLETRGKRSEVNKLMLDKYWGRFLFLNGKKKSLSSCKREYRQCTYCLPFPVSLERKRKNNPDSGPRNVKPLLLCTAVLSVQNKQNDAKVVKDAGDLPKSHSLWEIFNAHRRQPEIQKQSHLHEPEAS